MIEQNSLDQKLSWFKASMEVCWWCWNIFNEQWLKCGIENYAQSEWIKFSFVQTFMNILFNDIF